MLVKGATGILHWSLLHKGAMHRSFWGPWGGGKVINAPWINLQNSIRLSMIHPALMCFFRCKSNHYQRSPLIFRHGIMIPQLLPKSRNSRFIESCMMESSCSVVIDYKFITKNTYFDEGLSLFSNNFHTMLLVELLHQNTQIISDTLRFGYTYISHGSRKLQKKNHSNFINSIRKWSNFIDTISFLQSTFFLNLHNKVLSNVV